VVLLSGIIEMEATTMNARKLLSAVESADLLMCVGVKFTKKVEEGEDPDDALLEVRDDFETGLLSAPIPAHNTKGIADVYAGWGSRWAQNAFATILPTHQLAASLMCTSMSAEDAQKLQLPWDCFAVRLPRDLLGDNEDTIVLIRRGMGRNFPHTTIGILELSEHYASPRAIENLAALSDWDFDRRILKGEEALSEDLPKHSRRARLLGRLLLAICAEMDSPRGAQFIRNTPRTICMKRGEPKAWNFQLTRPIKLDVRKEVRAYLSGEGRQVTVQTFVRGHYKYQPCGVGGSQRKWIHVAAYWRGPEDAPIAVRPHVVS
jgi:hypothetical protein